MWTLSSGNSNHADDDSHTSLKVLDDRDIGTAPACPLASSLACGKRQRAARIHEWVVEMPPPYALAGPSFFQEGSANPAVRSEGGADGSQGGAAGGCVLCSACLARRAAEKAAAAAADEASQLTGPDAVARGGTPRPVVRKPVVPWLARVPPEGRVLIVSFLCAAAPLAAAPCRATRAAYNEMIAECAHKRLFGPDHTMAPSWFTALAVADLARFRDDDDLVPIRVSNIRDARLLLAALGGPTGAHAMGPVYGDGWMISTGALVFVGLDRLRMLELPGFRFQAVDIWVKVTEDPLATAAGWSLRSLRALLAGWTWEVSRLNGALAAAIHHRQVAASRMLIEAGAYMHGAVLYKGAYCTPASLSSSPEFQCAAMAVLTYVPKPLRNDPRWFEDVAPKDW